MKPYTFDLLFLESEESDIPHPPISHIWVKTSGNQPYRGVSKDLALITSRCGSISELEEEINRLQAELEAIRRVARERYAAYEAKRRKSS